MWLEESPTESVKTHRLEQGYAEPIELIAATCGLIHDLGNPPFGHAGEEAIQTWFQEKSKCKPDFFSGLKESPTADLIERMRQDLLKFEGNAQTTRIISRLQVLTDFFGLNLTWAPPTAR